LGGIRSWDSKWYAEKGFSLLLFEDIKIRKFLRKRLFRAAVSRIEIERASNKVRLNIYTARPGLVIGRKGAEIEGLEREIKKLTDRETIINIHEVRKPELDAQLVAQNVASQIEKRVAFRRAMKKSVASALRFGAEGIKISLAGRLGGAEMSRREWYREGRVPLHTLRADIDYGFVEAATTYGIIGVKVWIFKGEVLPSNERDAGER
jgi:small subunit ribosomal protein S3